LTLAAYVTRSPIRSTFVADVYRPGNLPPPSAMLPAPVIPCFAAPARPGACPFGGLAGLVPSDYSYRNLGGTVNRGVELALEQAFDEWTWFVNMSWQDDPDISGQGVNPAEVNIAPEWRVNLGLGRDMAKRFWSASVNYQDEAYWADVLFARAWTPAFTQVNAAYGWRFVDDRLTLKLVVQNLFDEEVQQHIFGDLISRKFAGQISYTF
jgi:outer membrane receptor protein involved in Fe transport